MPFLTSYGAINEGIPAQLAARRVDENYQQAVQNAQIESENADRQAEAANRRAAYGAIGQIGGTLGQLAVQKMKDKSELAKLAEQHGYKLDELHQAALDKTDMYEKMIEGKQDLADLNNASRERIQGMRGDTAESVQKLRNQGQIEKLGAAETYKQNALLNTADAARNVRDDMLKANPDIKDHPSFQMFSSAVEGGDPGVIKEASRGLFGSIRAEILQSQKSHAQQDLQTQKAADAAGLQTQKDAAAMDRAKVVTEGKKTPNQTSSERESANLSWKDLTTDYQIDTLTGKPLLGPDKKPRLTRKSAAEMNRRLNAKRMIEAALQSGGPKAMKAMADKLGMTPQMLDEMEQ